MKKLLYGALFVAVLPVALVAWARALEPQVHLPALRSLPAGWALVVAGAALVLAGWWALKVHGGGLPMNAFPPPLYVERGIYRVFAHPVYIGFTAVVLGVSVVAGSAAGAWIVTPAAALACAALVYGHERHDLVRRFGRLRRPWLWLPPRSDEPARWSDRLFIWGLVIAPLLGIYEAIAALGIPADAVSTALPFERDLPVWPWSELVYASIYPAVLLAPLIGRTRAALRDFSVRALLAMAVVFPLFLALPFVAPQRPVPPTILGLLLAEERALDTVSCAFPSLHVICALLVADMAPRGRGLAFAWAAAVSASCVMTSMHTVADVVAGFAVWALVRRAPAVWEGLRRAAERVANSWREWRVGPLRLINHGAWAALGTATALLIIGSFAGAAALPPIYLGTLVGSALWAQWLEGNSGLLRPYGFWGGVIGCIAGGWLAGFAGVDRWTAVAAGATAAPYIQSFGRLRCLVQGCCHGSLSPAAVGVTYRQPSSRVAHVPGLAGRPLHPTPLYSILWNVPVALFTTRLALAHVPGHLVAGIYLILAGAGRFVEESYRGEPQTPVVLGLRVYQWIALAAFLAGALITALATSAPMPAPRLDLAVAALALAGGALNFVAFGVDFPGSRRRFSRLA